VVFLFSRAMPNFQSGRRPPEEAIAFAGGAEVTSSDDMVLVYLVELDGG
jgi:hypothetical protein